MDYQKIYCSLIEKGQDRIKDPDIYYECHHIIPRCLGGTDELENLVYLTAEEHYVAHQLLVKINPGNFKLLSAATFMATDKFGRRINNKLFGWLRKQHSKAQRGRKMSKEARENLSLARKGRPLSEKQLEAIRMSSKIRSEKIKGLKRNSETIEKIRNARLGVKASEETKKNMSIAHTGHKPSKETIAKRVETTKARGKTNLGMIHAEESKLKMSESLKGRKFSEEHRQRLSESIKRAHERRRLEKEQLKNVV